MKWKVPMPKGLPAEGNSHVRVGVKSGETRFEFDSSEKGLPKDRVDLLMFALVANKEGIKKALKAIGDQS